MKKAKIMLIAIAVCVTVGTMLAFKVHKKGTTTYCYLFTSIEPPVGGCKGEITNAIAIGGQHVIYYTRKTAPCSTLACPNSANKFGL